MISIDTYTYGYLGHSRCYAISDVLEFDRIYHYVTRRVGRIQIPTSYIVYLLLNIPCRNYTESIPIDNTDVGLSSAFGRPTSRALVVLCRRLIPASLNKSNRVQFQSFHSLTCCSGLTNEFMELYLSPMC